jgi:hypothetical protein
MCTYDSNETMRHVEALVEPEVNAATEGGKQPDQVNEAPRDWLNALVTVYARSSRVRNPTTAANLFEPYYIMSEKKQEKDFTPEVDALLPEAKSLAEVAKPCEPKSPEC